MGSEMCIRDSHNNTTVDWFGAFVQGKYDIQKFNLYGMGGVSTIGYSYDDHFQVDFEKVEAPSITTFQVKGGGVFNLDDRLSALLILDMYRNHLS